MTLDPVDRPVDNPRTLLEARHAGRLDVLHALNEEARIVAPSQLPGWLRAHNLVRALVRETTQGGGR